jgi:ABC-2 type transport system permease protein
VTWAVFKVMLLTLIRDKGALLLAFILPPVVYILFAAIFAGTASDDLRLRLAVFDSVQSEATQRLVEELRADENFRTPTRSATSASDLEEMVKRDEADVGLHVRSDPAASGDAAPLLVLGDAAKAVAGPVAAGQIQRILSERLPDVTFTRQFADMEKTFVPLDAGQRQRVEAIIEKMKEDARAKQPGVALEASEGQLVERQSVATVETAKPSVVYYAGAVAMMFLLFASMQGAMQLIDERQSGVLERAAPAMGARIVMVSGKFLFLLLQGVMQSALIFAAAVVLYDVKLLNNLPLWFAITFAGAALASGLGLLLSAISRTRQQAQAISTFLILVLSAVGGSMVPRFLMPEWLQDMSLAVPNAWIIEAYHGLLWRGTNARDTLMLVLPATAVALACLVGAALFLGQGKRR